MIINCTKDPNVQPISRGGTGVTTIEDARNTFFEGDFLPIKYGGTGASTAENALANLGVADYIVEKYEEDNWFVTKWASGEAEARTMDFVASGTLSEMTAIGNVYYSASKTLALPTDLFVDTSYHVSSDLRTLGGPLGIYRQSDSTKSTLYYRVQKSNNSTSSVAFKVRVKGRWK